MGRKTTPKEMGFTLVDLLLSTLVGSIVTFICSSILFYQLDQLRAIRGLYAQNLILSYIRSTVSNISIMESKSDPSNIKLNQCLSGVDGTLCASADVYDLKLHSGGSVISGFPTDPVLYNTEMRNCVVSDGKSCMFAVSTQFRVQCKEELPTDLVPPPVCPGKSPGIIEVFYTFGFVGNVDKYRIVGLHPIKGSVILSL